MASLSLYRKWRSQTFSDLVGQETIVRTLINALKGGNLAHAYLFAGPRGTGKTSSARLLAKAINCSNPQDGEPCNRCQQCREITDGNSFNVIEIDAASNRGIDSIRELREKVLISPVTGKYKVYILDEAHMLTPEAFNALLKTLEEPPAHAIFVMATTDAHKMPTTVLSRCQRFDFKRIATRDIVERLHFVAEQEHVTLERGSAELIARAAGGGMRDALSLLDQSISYSSSPVISPTQVQAMLGVTDPRTIHQFIVHITQLDLPSGLHLIHELTEAGVDLRQVNAQIADILRAMMLSRAGAIIADIVDTTEEEMSEMIQDSLLFGLEELAEATRIFAQNDLVQKNIGPPQLGLELALLKCVELHRSRLTKLSQSPPEGDATSSSYPPSMPLPEGGESGEDASLQQDAPSSSIPSGVESILPPLSFVQQSQPTHSLVVPHNSAKNPPPKQETIDDHLLDELARPVEPRQEESSEGSTLTVQHVRDAWTNVKRRIKAKAGGAIIAALLNGYTVEAVEKREMLPVVVIQALADFHYTSIKTSDKHRNAISLALKDELGEECLLRLLPPDQREPSPRGPPNPPISTRTGKSASKESATARTQNQGNKQEGFPSNPIVPHVLQKRTQGHPHQFEAVTEGALALSVSDTSISIKKHDSDLQEHPSSNEEQRRHQVLANPVIQETIRLFQAQVKEVKFKKKE